MPAFRQVITEVIDRLATVGIETPRIDAELLAAYILNMPRSALITLDEISDDKAQQLAELVARRAQRVPLQHLTGQAPFRYLELHVGPGVFVPRPETELLVQWGLDFLGSSPSTVVDLCAGSGAIALSVAHERPTAQVFAVEREASAWVWLQRNARDRQAAGDQPIQLYLADATDAGILSELDSEVDLVLTNPPYIPLGSVVAPEAADYDPPAALWGGDDGLEIVRGLVTTAARLLRSGGCIGIEHGEQQVAGIAEIFAVSGQWQRVERHNDFTNRPRFTTAQRV